MRHVTTPTLALFGALDRNVDVTDSAKLFRAAFKAAGMRDFSVRVFPDAGHNFEVSKTGFSGDPARPRRLTHGYPQIMIDWLEQRGLAPRAGSAP